MNLKNWINAMFKIEPNIELDKLVKSNAKELLIVKNSKYKWGMIAVTISIAVWIVINLRLSNLKVRNEIVNTESPELILNYQTIELMAESDILSDEDWKSLK